VLIKEMPFYSYLIPLNVFFKKSLISYISQNAILKKEMIRKGGIILESYFVLLKSKLVLFF
jgi:hypothetical protein